MIVYCVCCYTDIVGLLTHVILGLGNTVDVCALLITLRASEAAAQCIVIGTVCLWVGVFVCVCVGLLPR